MVFWDEEKRDAFLQLSKDEKLEPKALEEVIGEYLFTEKSPMRDTVVGMMQERPAIRDRASTTDRITQKIKDFVETFISGISQ